MSPPRPDDPLQAGDAPARGGRPVHLRPAAVLLVVLGGTAGTAAREAISLVVPEVGGLPVAVLGINVVGALLLGALLEALVRRGPDEGRRLRLRLLLGTGFCGGFTTYSALAATTAVLLADGAIGPALGYALGTVLLGGLASWAGIALGRVRA